MSYLYTVTHATVLYYCNIYLHYAFYLFYYITTFNALTQSNDRKKELDVLFLFYLHDYLVI